jgi:hypothetical protein
MTYYIRIMQLTKKLQASFGHFKHLFLQKTQLLYNSIALVVLFCNSVAPHGVSCTSASHATFFEPASISKRNELPFLSSRFSNNKQCI